MTIPTRTPLLLLTLLTACAAAPNKPGDEVPRIPAGSSATSLTPNAQPPAPAPALETTVAPESAGFKRSAEFNIAILKEEKTCLCCRGAAGEAMAKVIQQLYDTNQFDTLRAMADANVAHAQYVLAMAYFRGHGVPHDTEQSINWLKRCAERGYGPAQFTLGYSYQNGDGVPRDDQQAVQWFGRAAVKGIVRAQMALAECYRYGRGTPVDTAEARAWYAKIASGDNCEFGEEARLALQEMR